MGPVEHWYLRRGQRKGASLCFPRNPTLLIHSKGYRFRPECRLNHDLHSVFELSPYDACESRGTINSRVIVSLHPCRGLQIFESGSQATLALFPAERGELDWQNFVRGVPYCASVATSGDTFSCLRDVNSTEIFQGLAAALAESTNKFPFAPVIDGSDGLIPDLPSVLFKRGQFTRLPFIAGTNLDEGTFSGSIDQIGLTYRI